MLRSGRIAFVLLFWWSACGVVFAQPYPLVLETEPLSPEEQLKRFQLPPGFEIQLVATEPQVRKPINLNFDAAGKLYATQSVEYPFPAAEGAPHRDAVGVYWDFGADGRARKIATAVSDLNIPIGVAPLSRDLLVYSIPHLYRCTDADGDGVYERKVPLYSGFGHDDTHGMINNIAPWIDGWVYCCHGFRNQSETAGQDGQKVSMQSGNTFRIKADGSHAEYFTHGQVNPFGLAFDSLGNLFSCDCHTMPAYQLLRGAYYPSFGKPHDGLGYGPEMMRHLHGSTGISGITYYGADHFPPEYRGTLFIGNPITARVNHDRLEPHGSTLTAIEQPDFLVCTDPWFRPVDIELGPDGALYIADFYNRIIGHYEVPLTHPGRDRERGRIWRVIYKGTDGKNPPPQMPGDLTKAGVDELVALLGHANLTVQTKAVNQLVERIGPPAADAVKKLLQDGMATTPQRAFGLWVIERLGGLDAVLAQRLADDPERQVRVQLVKALAERAKWDSVEIDIAGLVRCQLADADPFVRRAAADALGRHPSIKNIRPLVDLSYAVPADDTHLLHAVRMALRDQLLTPGNWAEVQILSETDAKLAARIADVCPGLPTKESADFLLYYLTVHSDDRGRLGEYLHHVARHCAADRLPAAYKLTEQFRQGSDREQLVAVRAAQRATQERAAALPDGLRAWSLALAGRLLARDVEQAVRDGLDLAREMRLTELHPAVASLTSNESPFGGLRQPAIDACVAIDSGRSIELLSSILGDGGDALDVRQKAASALAGINNDETRVVLLAQLKTAPDRVAAAIAAGLAASPAGAEALLSAIADGKASPRLLQDRVVDQRLRAANLPDFDPRLEKLTAGLPSVDERVAGLLNERRERFQKTDEFDLARGQAAYKKACAACHRLGGQGPKIGPELDGVGFRGVDRLLEDLLDPSRNVDGAFRSTQVTTTAGQTISGLKLRDEGQVLVLADAKGMEVRIPHGEIEEQHVTPLSPMPANVIDVVPEPDFYQLLGFLLSLRQKPMMKQP